MKMNRPEGVITELDRKGLTAKDVAAKIGLSRSSVSRILSGDEKPFNGETVNRVKEAARKLSYRPNALARNR